MSLIATTSLTTRIAAAAFALAIVGAGTAAAAAVSPAQDEPGAVVETTEAGTTAPETTAPEGTTPPETTAPETTAPETTAPPTLVAITCETARNHGEWVSYVASTTTGDKRGQIIREAAQSDCGKKVKATPDPTSTESPEAQGKAKAMQKKAAKKSKGRSGR